MSTPNAVIYSRFSPRSDAEDCTSIEHQWERCKLYCDKSGYTVYGNFADRAISGKNLDRPELNALLEVLQPGMVVVVDRNDRLARDMLVSLTIQHEIQKRGCTIEFADGSPQGTTPEGKLFQNILAAFAQFEREKFSARTAAGLARKKTEGVWIGRPPYGWRKLPEVDSLFRSVEEQETIQKIILTHNLGYSMPVIAKELNRQGNQNRGKPWTARSVRTILSRKTQDYA